MLNFSASDLDTQSKYLDESGQLVILGPKKLVHKKGSLEIRHRLTAFHPFILVIDHCRETN